MSIPANLIGPIFVFEDGHDLVVFASIDQATSYIEPWDADDGIWDGFDSVGRCLEITSGDVERIGRWTRRRKTIQWTVIRPTDRVDTERLSVRLASHVESVGPEQFRVAVGDASAMSLAGLVDLVADFHDVSIPASE